MIEYINLANIPIFLLIFVRLLGFFAVMPLFSYRTIPLPFKIGITFFLALVMLQTIDPHNVNLHNVYLFLLIKEALVGLFIGLLAYIILSAVQIAGGFIDFQMGFAIANVVDPQTGAQSPLIGQYFYIFALLFLLSVNGHHMLIDGMYYSFELVALDEFVPFMNESIPSFILQMFNQTFLIAFQMAIPLVGSLFLVDVALGLIARTVPQLNVFVVGLPLKITVSFVIILLFLNLYVTVVQSLFEMMFQAMRSLLELFGGA